MTLGQSPAINGSTVLSIAEGFEIQSFDDGGVILNTGTGQLYSCNSVTMAYLGRIDGSRTIEALASGVAEEFVVSDSQAKADLIEISAELVKEQILIVR